MYDIKHPVKVHSQSDTETFILKFFFLHVDESCEGIATSLPKRSFHVGGTAESQIKFSSAHCILLRFSTDAYISGEQNPFIIATLACELIS